MLEKDNHLMLKKTYGLEFPTTTSNQKDWYYYLLSNVGNKKYFLQIAMIKKNIINL